MAGEQRRSLQDVELDLLRSLQSIESPFLHFLADAIHNIIRDDVLVFPAPTALLVLESPTFGLALLITLSLTELLNGIIKLYCVRPRPLWVSTALHRKSSAWEKDSSFPSSHSQTIATVFSFLLFQGQNELSHSTWTALVYATGLFTLLTGFSRVYLAMHYVSDVIVGWLLGFVVAFLVYKMSLVSTLARLPMTHSIGISVFSTAYILGVLILASQSGRTDISPQDLERWLKNARGKVAKNVSPKKKHSPETIQLHNITGYQMPLGVYFGATTALSFLSHMIPASNLSSTPILSYYRPHSHYSQAPPFFRFIIGIGGMLILDTLKSLMFKREKRVLWPEWQQSTFAFVFNSVIAAWVVLGSSLVCIWGWPLEAAVS